MAESFDSFNEETQRSRVAAGMRGGPFFEKPVLEPKLSIVNGVQPEVEKEIEAKAFTKVPLENPWFSRR